MEHRRGTGVARQDGFYRRFRLARQSNLWVGKRPAKTWDCGWRTRKPLRNRHRRCRRRARPGRLVRRCSEVVEQHRLAHVKLRLRSHEPAVGVDHLRHDFELLGFAPDVFRDHRNAHAQHDAFAAAAVFRIGRACHDTEKELCFELILPCESAWQRWPQRPALRKEIEGERLLVDGISFVAGRIEQPFKRSPHAGRFGVHKAEARTCRLAPTMGVTTISVREILARRSAASGNLDNSSSCCWIVGNLREMFRYA